MKINLPNKLTIARIILCPFFMIFIVYPIPSEVWSRIIAAALFLLATITDALGGQIARSKKLVTDFGKFLDPLADKFMVIGAMVCFCVTEKGNLSDPVFKNVIFWATIIVILRELAVTSLRLLVSNSSGVVIAAKWKGKVKTFLQCMTVIVILLEPIVFPDSMKVFHEGSLLSYIMIVLTVVMTIWSGYDYIKGYWDLIDPTK